MNSYTNRRDLTDRQLQVAFLVARGYSNADIGDELHLTINTVKRHVFNIMNKLAANNRADVARLVAEGKVSTRSSRSE